MKFRNDIQGLRAIAVLLVLIFHLNSSYLPGGFIGVDIFFVISGYLVSSIIIDKKGKDSFNLSGFYIGRVKRIVPAYLCFLIIIFLLGCFVYFPMDIGGLRKNIFYAAIFNSNNYLASLDTYFGASSSENPLLHTWTLAIEMQFYFILPLFLMLVNRKYYAPVLIFLIIALFGYSYYNSTFLSNKSGMYFSLAARMPEFLIGTLMAVKGSLLEVKQPRFKNLCSLGALITIVITALLLNEKSNFPGVIVLVPCISVAFILINSDSVLNKSILSNKVLVYIGELSYSIYLWHWGLMALLRYSNLRYQFTLSEVALLMIVIGVFSYLSYKYIESYFRKIQTNNLIKVISASLAILCITAYLAPKVNNAIYPIPKKYSYATFGLDSHSDTFKFPERFGDLNKKKDSILLIGDSFALMYKPVLDYIGKRHGFNFLTVTNDGTPLIPGIAREDFSNNSLFTRYQKLSKQSSALIKQSNLILISSSWRHEITSLPQAFGAFAKLLRPNQTVIILSNFPSLNKNPIKVNRGVVRNVSVDNNYVLKTRQIPDEIIRI
ncbi:acyltransferase family protein [Mucilaginibacter agri]|uniref:Acyltransferase family protein n=1 Tax=Mucilaginibacter agri TaxID=2695265 RepID=A0A965ZGL4_9SPHI|nr:acyltransferase family protein [Mucilaginibacter agri]NCD69376.1 acyltransferase family protein [Mucilaginibacter agri]